MNTQTTLDDQKDNDLDNSIAGGITVNHIVKWVGSAWSALGMGTDGSVDNIVAIPNGHVYIGKQSNGSPDYTYAKKALEKRAKYYRKLRGSI